MKVKNHKLHVISVISNPVRYKSRYKLYRKFAKQMERAGVELWTVECQLGKRKFHVTDKCNPRHIQVRATSEIWHKENLINLGVQRITQQFPNWKYLAWVDADIEFLNKNWVHDTWQALQHYHVVQMFQSAIDLGPNGETMSVCNSMMYAHVQGLPVTTKYGYPYPHSGYAWACTRYAWDKLGGLIDRAVLGSADHHMALSLLGIGEKSYPRQIHKNYKEMVLAWQGRANKYIKHDVGFVPGTIAHWFHGSKKKRYYVDRWQILIRSNFDPIGDLNRNCNGVLELDEHRHELRDDIRRYFRARHEDGIEP